MTGELLLFLFHSSGNVLLHQGLVGNIELIRLDFDLIDDVFWETQGNGARGGFKIWENNIACLGPIHILGRIVGILKLCLFVFVMKLWNFFASFCHR